MSTMLSELEVELTGDLLYVIFFYNSDQVLSDVER
jgi:hypothetical protein